MSLDLENYNFTNERPTTALYERMQELSIPLIAKFLEDLIELNTNKRLLSYSPTSIFILFTEYIEQNKFKDYLQIDNI